MHQGTDDLGAAVPIPHPVRRVVSLVPSLTETLAVSAPELLVGATDWCTHPADLDVVRVRGTKNPDVRAVVSLAPDLVLANKEENRQLDVERLRAAGVAVWVTDITTIHGALRSLHRVLTGALGVPEPDWLMQARAVWSAPPERPELGAIVPVWRDPWMIVGPDTFTADVLRGIGVRVLAPTSTQRYPRIDPGPMHDLGADVVVLPDEPYVFTAEDGPECFADQPVVLVSGRALTWYGPSLVGARSQLSAAIRPANP